jgi:hypothetical protein
MNASVTGQPQPRGAPPEQARGEDLRPGPVLLLALLAACAWEIYRNAAYVVDDVYINLRYARHLVEGAGLVFNPGERVEGYTNVTVVLLAALFLRFGLDPVMGLKVVAPLAGLACLWLVGRLERLLAPAETFGRLPLSPLLLLPLGAFVYWAFCPMGTMEFTALLLAGIVLLLRERAGGRWLGSGLVFAVLAVTRPEGIYAFAVLTLACLLADRVHGRGWRHLGGHVANVACVAVALGAYTAWRYRYFGELLPNTYHAKVTGGTGQLATGLRYLASWLLAFPVLGLSLLLPVAALLRRSRARRTTPPAVCHPPRDPVPLSVLYVLTAGYVAAVVAIGGDFMPFFRFFIPVMPLCAVLVASAAAVGAARLSASRRRRALAALLAVNLVAAAATEEPYRAFVADRTAILGSRAGRWLAARLAPGDLIAVNTAGALPYAAGLPAIDMLGLTDAAIAHRPVFVVSAGWAGHRRGWGEYVLARRPRVIIWYNSVGAVEPFYLSDRELAGDPLFRFFYRLRSTVLPPPATADPNAALRRFAGFPFGFVPSGEAAMEDLGVRASFGRRPVPHTTFFEGSARLTYFELDVRDADLWGDAWRHRGDIGAFLDVAAARWKERARHPPVDESARTHVSALCADAYRAIAAGEHARARRLLDDALRRNREVGSPLVYQYAANLAVITGRLFAALDAQKEALRLAPESALYRENLRNLLTVSYEQFRSRAAPLADARPGSAPPEPAAPASPAPGAGAPGAAAPGPAPTVATLPAE